MDNLTQVLQLIPEAIKINTTTKFSVGVAYIEPLEGFEFTIYSSKERGAELVLMVDVKLDGDRNEELDSIRTQFDAILQPSLLTN